MPRFFINSDGLISREGSDFCLISGNDASHITRVLRMRVGESLIVCDASGVEYETVIASLGEIVECRVISSKKSENEPPYRAVIYQSLVKGDRFDTVLQKSTELGAHSIVPVITSRCTVKLDLKDQAHKIDRWQKIVNEASKQCGRAVIPKVELPMKFADAVKEASCASLALFCYEGEGTRPLPFHMDEVKNPETVSVMIGPEGGYSPEEASFAGENGMRAVGLGKRILRTETAPLYVLSCLSAEYELRCE